MGFFFFFFERPYLIGASLFFVPASARITLLTILLDVGWDIFPSSPSTSVVLEYLEISYKRCHQRQQIACNVTF